MANGLYSFFWGDYCDWYLEATKARRTDESQKAHILAIQDIVLRQTLQLLHPITPHITEELWHKLGFAKGEELLQQTRIMTAQELEAAFSRMGLDGVQAEFVSELSQLVAVGRQMKADRGLGNHRDSVFFFKTASVDRIAPQKETLERFLGAKELKLGDKDMADAPAGVTPLGTLYLELSSTVSDEDRAKLTKQLEELEKFIAASEAKLANPAFADKAPANVVDGVRKSCEQNKAKADELRRILQPVSKE
jgi:valyl-tRNA synthetase